MSRRSLRRSIFYVVLLLLFGLPASAQDTPTPEPQIYRVRSGDTLGSIASRYHTTVSDIMKLNDLTNPELIVIGQTLQIPSSAPAAPAPEPTGEPPAETTPQALAPPDFDYGVEAFFDGQDVGSVIQQIAGLGMHWVKVRASWRDIEPVQGSPDFARLDAIVDGLRASGLNVLLTVTDAPDWARSSREEHGPPDNFATYNTFVGALALRYAGRVAAYEIWNEPNLRREWNSTIFPIGADSYALLLHAAYGTIKAADPNATVVSAGLAPTGFNDGVNAIDDRQFLARLYDLGLVDMSDAVGAHPFGFANPPDFVCCAALEDVLTHYGQPSFYFLDTLNDYHEIMRQHGDMSTPLWVTQFGWGTSDGIGAPPRNSLYVRYNSPEEQAQYDERAFELGASLGFVRMMFVYNLNSCTAQPENLEACYYSLIAPSGQPRPAYQALSAAFAVAGG